MELQTLSKAKAKEIKRLSTKKERDRQGLFLAEGEKCVRDLLGFFDVENLIATRSWINNNPDIVKKFGDKTLVAEPKGIEIISSLQSKPEVIAVLKKYHFLDEVPKLKEGKLYLLLDEIQDPGNLGTIIRTCDWFGVYEIYASKNTVDVYSPKVVQATMGSLSRVKVGYVDLEELVDNNRELKLIGTLLDGIPLANRPLNVTGMLLMGNEGRGISEELKKKIDLALTIPPSNPKSHPDSLNVAIATAILLENLSIH